MGATFTVPVRFRLDELLDERKAKGDAITQTDLARRSGARRAPRAEAGAGMTRVALLAASLALGCSEGTGPRAGDAPGTFTATLSGALSQTASGVATYAVGLYTYRVDLLQNPNGAGFTLFFNADGGRPSVGTYAVTPITSPQPLPTVNAQACVDYTGVCPPVWGVHREPPPGAGRLEITESTPTSVAGTLEVDLRGTADGTGPILHVSARFNARCREGALC